MTSRVSRSQSVRIVELEEMARRFAFLPQPLLAAAEEHDVAPRERLAQRLAIHVTKHQHGAGVGVLDHSRQQPSPLAKSSESMSATVTVRRIAASASSWPHLDPGRPQLALEIGESQSRQSETRWPPAPHPPPRP